MRQILIDLLVQYHLKCSKKQLKMHNQLEKMIEEQDFSVTLKQREILQDYYRLATLSKLSEIEGKHLEKILDLAQDDDQLYELMNKVDELTFQELGYEIDEFKDSQQTIKNLHKSVSQEKMYDRNTIFQEPVLNHNKVTKLFFLWCRCGAIAILFIAGFYMAEQKMNQQSSIAVSTFEPLKVNFPPIDEILKKENYSTSQDDLFWSATSIMLGNPESTPYQDGIAEDELDINVENSGTSNPESMPYQDGIPEDKLDINVENSDTSNPESMPYQDGIPEDKLDINVENSGIANVEPTPYQDGIPGNTRLGSCR